MTSKDATPRRVIYAVAALQELDEIWDWNEKTYGRERAVRYFDFLDQHVMELSVDPLKGRPVPGRQDLRYLPMKRRSRGHGHLAVYRTGEDAVHILHIFHTAQDWQKFLGSVS
jgi:plasmid stabilization system protein ParE